jgi:hypothetical protein
MKEQEKRAEQERPPIVDKDQLDKIAEWLESGLEPPEWERELIKYVDLVTASIIALCAIGLIILAIDFYFFN